MRNLRDQSGREGGKHALFHPPSLDIGVIFWDLFLEFVFIMGAYGLLYIFVCVSERELGI